MGNWVGMLFVLSRTSSFTKSFQFTVQAIDFILKLITVTDSFHSSNVNTDWSMFVVSNGVQGVIIEVDRSQYDAIFDQFELMHNAI